MTTTINLEKSVHLHKCQHKALVYVRTCMNHCSIIYTMCMIACAHQRSDDPTVVGYYQLGNGAGVPYII